MADTMSVAEAVAILWRLRDDSAQTMARRQADLEAKQLDNPDASMTEWEKSSYDEARDQVSALDIACAALTVADPRLAHTR